MIQQGCDRVGTLDAVTSFIWLSRPLIVKVGTSTTRESRQETRFFLQHAGNVHELDDH